MKKILLYGLNDETADQYQTLAANNSIAMYIINDSMLDTSVEKLFEINDDLDNQHADFENAYMVLQEIEVNELVLLLKQMDSIGKPFEGIKIMRTESNRQWSMRELFIQAEKEYNVTKKAMVLQELIRSCNGLDVSELDPHQRNEFKDGIMNGYMLLKSGEYDEDALNAAIAVLSENLKNCRRLYN